MRKEKKFWKDKQRFQSQQPKRDVNVAEDVVEAVLKSMTTAGEIAGFIRNDKNGQMDREGIDFLIFMKNGAAIPLQVKTASHGELRDDKAYREHIHKHPMVKFLIAVPIRYLHSEQERLYKLIHNEIAQIIEKALKAQ